MPASKSLKNNHPPPPTGILFATEKQATFLENIPNAIVRVHKIGTRGHGTTAVANQARPFGEGRGRCIRVCVRVRTMFPVGLRTGRK